VGNEAECSHGATRIEGIATKGLGEEETFVWDHWIVVCSGFDVVF